MVDENSVYHIYLSKEDTIGRNFNSILLDTMTDEGGNRTYNEASCTKPSKVE